MSYPRFRTSRAHKIVTRATGTDISLTATAVSELAAATNGPGTGGFDIVLAAQVGDVIECGMSGMVKSTAEYVGFDIYTIVSAATVNPFGVGLSASLATLSGVSSWHCDNTATQRPLAGSILRTLVSGDLSSGFVTVRPYYAKANTNARGMYSSANLGFAFWAKNLGPADPN